MPSAGASFFHIWESNIVRYTQIRRTPRSFDFHKHAPNYLIQKTGFNRPRIQRPNSSSIVYENSIQNIVAWQLPHHFPPYRLCGGCSLFIDQKYRRANLNTTRLTCCSVCVNIVHCVCAADAYSWCAWRALVTKQHTRKTRYLNVVLGEQLQMQLGCGANDLATCVCAFACVCVRINFHLNDCPLECCRSLFLSFLLQVKSIIFNQIQF